MTHAVGERDMPRVAVVTLISRVSLTSGDYIVNVTE